MGNTFGKEDEILKKAYFMMNSESFQLIYGKDELKRIRTLVELEPELIVPDKNGYVEKVPNDGQIILSGWGGPRIDKRFLDSMTGLEAVFYGAGSIRGIVTDDFWEKKVVITSSWSANAVPVAEYTFAQIILCLKNAYQLNKGYCREKDSYDKTKRFANGAYKTRVGIISLGLIGKLVCKFLRSIDVEVLAYDPYADKEEARELGVRFADLEEIFGTCHVVSLHAPWLKETEGMIREEHFIRMLPNSAFINTARGAIVNEGEMVSVLSERKDITAVLDVTYPEPPESGSPLYNMENVFLTPHIAGSMDGECARMGRYAVDELERYLSNEQMLYRITKEMAERMA